MKKINKIALFAFALLLTTSCKERQRKSANNDKPVITVTIEPQRYFTEAIAGDKFTVTSMVPKGVSPETYDPIPQQLAELGNSKAYFRIGYIGFEQVWMDRLINNTPHIQIFDTSKGVDFILNDEQADHHHEAHPNQNTEPHIWNSTSNALIIAKNIYKALSTIDKKNEVFYLTRYDSLCRRIEHTDSLIRKIIAEPGTSRSFMIYHPALTYFAHDYGLQQIPIEWEGKEPSPQYLKKLIDRCKKEQVRVIFIQPEFDRHNAEIIAQQTGARIVPINPLSYDWEKEMLHIAQALAGSKSE